MEKFEYRKVEGELLEEDLNEFGKEGWELCGYTSIPRADLRNPSVHTVNTTQIFKRSLKNVD